MTVLLIALLLQIGNDLELILEDERMARDEELADPGYASPLTAMGQTMVESGGFTLLVDCNGKIQFASEMQCHPLVEFQFDRGRFLAQPFPKTKGVWGPGTPFARELSITPGSSDIRGRLLLTEPANVNGLAIFFSLQGGSGRVMLHNTRSSRLSTFDGLNYFEVDPDYYFVVRIEPDPEPETIEMATTQGLQKKFRRLGTVPFKTPEGERRLSVFSPNDSPRDYFIPFRDKTNGKETYPMGRYLYLQEGPEPRTFVLDFNRAFNPYCAYNQHYNCPDPPEENHLDIPIPAGEKLFQKE
jgi:hypothetical protein